MAGRSQPLEGGKKSVYFSGEQLAEMEARGLTPAEIVRRGFLWRDAPAMPPDLVPSMTLISRVAAVLLNGGTITYPDQSGSPG